MSAHKDSIQEVDFKDKISTVETSGKRKWIYALEPKGKLYSLRSYISYLFIAVLFIIPFIRVKGVPLIQLNLPKGIFILFGKVFYPQDFILLGIAMIIVVLFIVLFTLAFGRVFCGWVCPQTVFLEFIFRRIEYWIEGPANKQRINDSKEWTSELYLRKFIKHIVFLTISFLISNIFLSYIIGTDGLWKIIKEPITSHLIGFVAIIVFSLVFYFVFAYAREIVCTVVCPYGRLQSVLLDKNSIVVAYNYLRGEPRAKSSKNRPLDAGDCIDCDLCVQVCPTGIDIRNGIQMECTHCTACIDACNLMMEKTGREKNLIKYTSENHIKEGTKLKFTYRLQVYSIALVVLIGLFSFLLVTRKPLDITILRVPGQLIKENADGTISNLYRMKVINKTLQTLDFNLTSSDADVLIKFVGNGALPLHANEQREYMFFLEKPTAKISERKENIKIKIISDQKIVDTKSIYFIGQN